MKVVEAVELATLLTDTQLKVIFDLPEGVTVKFVGTLTFEATKGVFKLSLTLPEEFIKADL
jgi:hypothetical protein